uniref:DEAD-box RNA helicase Q domain-containing protein n=1 Tax=Hippocampus comes TaxID=109280 RepID=A0A3Q2YM35_HIPCM
MENTTDGTWDTLAVKLNDNILETLRELKFTHMTPVQVCSMDENPTYNFNQNSTVLYTSLCACVFICFCLPSRLPVSHFL